MNTKESMSLQEKQDNTTLTPNTPLGLNPPFGVYCRAVHLSFIPRASQKKKISYQGMHVIGRKPCLKNRVRAFTNSDDHNKCRYDG